MNRFIYSTIAGLLIAVTILITDICAEDRVAFSTKPIITNSGEKWRIGYLEGGPYSNYQSIFRAMISTLMESGWIEKAVIPECKDEAETKTLWDFLATDARSNYLKFSIDAYYGAQWNKEKREKIKSNIIKRLNSKKDLDLMLCFGTWAGQDLANNQHKTSIMVLSASNAVQSGIIKSVEDSGFDHVHAFIDPDRSKRQLRLFHEIAGFKKLGLAYENSSSGRSYAAVDDVIQLSQELGFEVVECAMPEDNQTPEIEDAQLVECYEKLAPKIDAVYMTDDSSLNINTIKKLLSPLFKYKVAMFAQARYDLVKYGILMGSGRSDFKSDAKFYARVFSKILNGASPGSLSQKFESPLKIAINLESTQKLSFRLPIEVIAGADEIYEKILDPENDK